MGTFGENLKKIRIEKNMSQEEFATLLGTSKQVISRYENDQRSPKVSVVAQYAKILGVSIGTLSGETTKNKRPAEADEPSNESRFMKLYSRLDDEGRDLFDCYLDLPRERRHLLVLVARSFQADAAPPPVPPRSAL